MNAGSLAGVCLTLALVLGLLGLLVRLLRRFTMGVAGGRGRLPMEVVQRLALGPKQGIAVVRIGDQLLAVSLGEGGVRPLAELGDGERALLLGERQLHDGTSVSTVMTPVAMTPVAPRAHWQPDVSQPAPAAASVRATLLSPLPPMTAVAEPTTRQEVQPAAQSVARTMASDFGSLLRMAVRGGSTALLAGIVLAGTSNSLFAQGATTPAATATQQPIAAQPAPAITPTGAGQARPLTPAPITSVVQAPGAARTPATTAGQQPAPAGVAATATTGITPTGGVNAGVADEMITRLAPTMDLRLGGEEEGGLRLSGTVGVIVMMGLLTLLPTLLLMMTGFTRILIVLHFLRQALGTQSAPPSHLVAGLALLLTGFVMAPTLREVNETALQPWMNGEIVQTEMLSRGVVPFREFMARQTRDGDIRAFLDMSDAPEPATIDEVPLVVLTSAFVTSELRTAFQIGFALFLPFIVIDVVVASVLMSMGMFMLPPAMISLPFKLLLFVLVDGWALLTQSIVASFR